ncbi:hypothetical protein LzC2_12110 [Planctomycetes bacterium LzC2]|uniref:XRE family transcriptional regulator n=1 Tax=Alienimonas chondri TaxID=2681879 RepID=A0ABX1VCW7_9PLAN|nr:hypothetical protein [Alienimonas chondri]
MTTSKPTEEAFWSRNSKPTSQRKLKKLAALYDVDLRSITALFSAHADFDERENRPFDDGAIVPEAERAHLIESGVIPAPRRLSRDDLLAWLTEAWEACDRTAVRDAFIIGTANGRYDFRSALGTYASFHSLSGPDRDDAVRRGIAGLPDEGTTVDQTTVESELIYYAFKRFWMPYMVMDHADYAAFDLSQFNKRPVPEPTDAQRENFTALLDAIRALPADAKLTDLQKAGTGLVKGNKYDRIHLLEILGYCDILGSPDHPPVRERFVNQENRPQPEHFYSRDWHFPANLWDGTVGVNEEAVAYWFPGYER